MSGSRTVPIMCESVCVGVLTYTSVYVCNHFANMFAIVSEAPPVAYGEI